MFYSSLAYGTFAASVAYIALPVVMVTSICIGLFGAFLNIGGGVALADCTNDSNRGLYSGIFNAFNQGMNEDLSKSH
jgi:integral membrane sensor domain MASE1